jgi:hypothetical protein
MKPSRAARSFVRFATTHRDFLDLIEPIDGSEKIRRAFKVERAVWRTEGGNRRDAVKLGRAVLNSVPKRHRERLWKAFDAYVTAETTSLLVREQTAYLVGLEMGRRMRR